MDRQYIRDHQVVERYLRGQLSADEERALEEAYLADPDLLDEVQLVERLRQGFKDLDAAGGIHRQRRAGAAWLRSLASPQYAAAASVLLMMSLVFSGALYRENLSLQQGGGLVADTAVTRLLPVVTVRGDPASVLEAPGENELAVLLVDPGFSGHDRYRVIVSRRTEQGSAEIWSGDGLVPGYEDLLAVGMAGRLLTPGDYEIEIEGRMNDWPPGRGFEPVTRTTVRIVARE